MECLLNFNITWWEIGNFHSSFKLCPKPHFGPDSINCKWPPKYFPVSLNPLWWKILPTVTVKSTLLTGALSVAKIMPYLALVHNWTMISMYDFLFSFEFPVVFFSPFCQTRSTFLHVAVQILQFLTYVISETQVTSTFILKVISGPAAFLF